MKKMVSTFFVFGCLVVAIPGSATADCSSRVWDCAKEAYKNQGFWSWYAAQIDCELNYVECQRIALIGR